MAHVYSIKINRNKIQGSINNHSRLSKHILKRIKTLSFIDPLYIKDVYEYIKDDAEDDKKNKLFVKYFEKTYLIKYDIKNWNY